MVSVPMQIVTARTDMPAVNEGDEGANVKQVKNSDAKKKVQELVFIVENGKAKSVNVETGISDDNYLQIKSGLKGGEQVVSGSYSAISRELKDGAVVRVEEKNQKANNNKEKTE